MKIENGKYYRTADGRKVGPIRGGPATYHAQGADHWYDVRKWFYYPIEMPLSADGNGPAKVGTDAVNITYEVWDVLLNTHASFDNLPDAINEAMRLNAKLKGIEQ